jgi:protein-disulfide isomerase
MATADQKHHARAQREAAQSATEAAERRSRNVRILAGAVLAALVLVVAVVVLGNRDQSVAPEAPQVAGVAETRDLLAGVEQNGLTLGDPKAPVTILEFLDVQCPFCRDHQLDDQPRIITELVKTGKARLTMQPLALEMMGEDSVAGRTVTLRLAERNVAWNFVNLFYFNQGEEQTGYVTDAYLRKLVAAVPNTATGSTTAPADAARTSDAKITAQAAEIDAAAKLVAEKFSAAGKTFGTPAFAVAKTGAKPADFTPVFLNGSGNADQLIAAVGELR